MEQRAPQLPALLRGLPRAWPLRAAPPAVAAHACVCLCVRLYVCVCICACAIVNACGHLGSYYPNLPSSLWPSPPGYTIQLCLKGPCFLLCFQGAPHRLCSRRLCCIRRGACRLQRTCGFIGTRVLCNLRTCIHTVNHRVCTRPSPSPRTFRPLAPLLCCPALHLCLACRSSLGRCCLVLRCCVGLCCFCCAPCLVRPRTCEDVDTCGAAADGRSAAGMQCKRAGCPQRAAPTSCHAASKAPSASTQRCRHRATVLPATSMSWLCCDRAWSSTEGGGAAGSRGCCCCCCCCCCCWRGGGGGDGGPCGGPAACTSSCSARLAVPAPLPLLNCCCCCCCCCSGVVGAQRAAGEAAAVCCFTFSPPGTADAAPSSSSSSSPLSISSSSSQAYSPSNAMPEKKTVMMYRRNAHTRTIQHCGPHDAPSASPSAAILCCRLLAEVKHVADRNLLLLGALCQPAPPLLALAPLALLVSWWGERQLAAAFPPLPAIAHFTPEEEGRVACAAAVEGRVLVGRGMWMGLCVTDKAAIPCLQSRRQATLRGEAAQHA